MSRGGLFFTVFPLVAVAAAVWISARLPWTTLRIVGLVIMVVFLVLLTIARLQLGRAFSITPQARLLVTHGVYSKIRHPVYVFSAFAIVGFALYLQLYWLLIFLAVVVPVQVWRARKEEAVLTERFGQAYLEYRKSTWL